MTTFKTRTRALDMLGRQQIAGIPTAISELFKNAHDAYADHVAIDYYRSDDLFVLRDDGVGMSREDFVTRWLTLGTESKLGPDRQPPRAHGRKPRPILGEKGIGRLAIATIGPQLLVLTRAKTDGQPSDLTAAFLSWRIFEWPEINLEDIDIPLRSFPPGTLPSARDVAAMVDEFRATAGNASHRVEPWRLEKLMDELDQFDIDPRDIDTYLAEPSLLGPGNSGTHLIIKPASPLLADDIDGDPTTRKATPLKKMLLGSANTMIPGSRAVIHTAFRDHKTEELTDELIAEDEFFTPDDFESADHRVHGTFDALGQFQGSISIGGKTGIDHVIPWTAGRGARTSCGPFSIDLAILESESRHSTLPGEDYARLALKTEQMGGLYIYRNGTRVLPYGDTDYDWLDIELRRTKSAQYYYFSHRKMFGAVQIDTDGNHDLLEKAGREGFQENRAYRQLRSILRNFFLQLAADFFRARGGHSATTDPQEAKLSRETKARRQREEHVSERREKLKASLDTFFDQIENNRPRAEGSALIERMETGLRRAHGMADSRLAAIKILDLERRARAELRSLETRYRIEPPQIGLSKAMLRDWSAYTTELATLQKTVFDPVRKIIDDRINEEIEKRTLPLDRRSRTRSALEHLRRESRKTIDGSAQAVRMEADKIASQAREAAELSLKSLKSLKSIESEQQKVPSETRHTDLPEASDEQLAETASTLESQLLKTTREQEALLRSVLAQLQAVDVTGEHSTAEQLMAIEQRNLLLEEEAETNAQLAQLGMAVEIINHEFSGTIRSVRNGLRKLKRWADANEGLKELYDDIRTSFDHLDGYLTLFTPLQRRLYRRAVEIRGSEIHDFLEELFRARMARHDIALTATSAFAKAKIVGFPSSFYPVFVNLMDNAIFWLSQQNPQHERRIQLDERDGALRVSDTGPSIDPRDREAIFEPGFSRKPGGRGIGLHIGREALRRVGFDLQLIDGDGGTTFGVVPVDES